MLTMQGVSKSFLGVRVLEGVGLDLEAGEVHALVGENGAGKSTLMKILAGEHLPDAGTITIDGTGRSFGHPAEAQAAGVGIIHQEFALLTHRTVAENVFLGREPTRYGLVDRRAMERRTAELLAELDETGITPRTPVHELSVARRQTVEIVKALASDVRILVMDEPTAALADHEVERLGSLVRRLTARGIGILYISHRLREVFDLSRRITVLKDGRRVTTLDTRETDADTVVRAMVGRELGAYYPPRAGPGEPGKERLTVRGGGNSRISGIDLTLRAGEVVGVAGLQGSGRTSLARALFGAAPFTTGAMTVGGEPLRPANPREAVRAGIALVTEDRKGEGLALHQSVADNALLVTRAVPARGRPAARREVTALLERVRLHAHGEDQQVQYLSGGNQQKVVIARWLAARPRVLLFDEPTRGVDVGAKAAIHTLVRELAREGLAVLIISSELPELIGMSDRILVMSEGRLAGELPAGAAEESVMRLATGGGSATEGTA
ncbi:MULTISPECIES: sugar ABC transporter ATP-binding protein [unclassified Streptomyces]|uniref:sugar ABC transporter ATP-binding protein n=1 Tax=unclassified Streptomyces TaxID=2593676 RepID=UPI002250EF22|nr:sugar ABC transporter ATP-binding protein [Streptomyces sp. NBC_00062]MCX5433805.1 sugar ABC transporter ATP-binding protein [Streptomyces sp. NBC_00062]WTB52217.1 sugar ABC transporter ATP-binding protein [Streptomyces sp. NBC_00826]WTH94892.1 sugar ABC transporter ATP-binding protein [Streptomyces sp. NBC_00825]WTI03626.1 sugar ABC transporter ATP-binding protein [Streptomyces sp. NBC_00822]